MRPVEQLDVSYSTNENCCSVFVGVCQSQKLFEQYWEKDYELLGDDYIGFEMGILNLQLGYGKIEPINLEGRERA